MSNDQDYGEDDSSNAVPDEDGVVQIRSENIKGRDDFKWTERSSRRLLELRFERDAEFSKPTCRKIKLWEQISQEMIKLGYPVSAHGCDNKYRNLLATYRKNKIKLVTHEVTCVSWEFFELIDYYLGAKYDAAIESASSPAIDFEVTPTFDYSDFELDDASRYLIRPTPSKRFKTASGHTAISVNVPSSPREDRKLSTQEYFYEKTNLDKMSFKEDSRRKARQLEIQERKLKLAEKRIELETKRIELESKKVEALAALATAISGLKSIIK